jgi:ribosomal protein S18 acetylase RimI-like enzyme
VHYRLYTSDDFAQLYAIEEACFEHRLRFDRRYMQRLVTRPSAATWIAEHERRMAGFAAVGLSRQKNVDVAYIQTLEVLPEMRGQGSGAELLRRIEKSAHAAGATVIWLHVDETNAGAIRLYEAAGYLHTGREKDFYPEGRPALIYQKPLGSELASQQDSKSATQR